MTAVTLAGGHLEPTSRGAAANFFRCVRAGVGAGRDERESRNQPTASRKLLRFGAGALLPARAGSVRQPRFNVGSPLLVYGSSLPAPTPPSAHSDGTPFARADGVRSTTNVGPQLDAEQAPARDVSAVSPDKTLVSVHREPHDVAGDRRQPQRGRVYHLGVVRRLMSSGGVHHDVDAAATA